jgi:hypothetical protein
MEYTVILMNKTLAATFVTLAVAALVTGTTTIGTLQSANAQGDLPRDLGILSTIARYNQVNVRVYASVLQGGKIHRGDLVKLEG